MKTAQEWLTELSSGTTQAFPNIQRADMLTGLKERIATPKKISQANTSLCGAASLMYCLAALKDAVYAQYVVELYQTGTGKLGGLTIKPGTDCKKYKPSTAKGIHPADWVALASLRDSENDVFDYAEPSNEAGGITMPGDLLDWFISSGFSKGANYTNLVFTKDEKTIKDLTDKYVQGHSICLFINANLLLHPDKSSAIPDHWIVPTSPATIADGKISVNVFSWGDIQKVELSVATFCKNFYGYISSSAS
jgi:hypothetical protein